MIDLINEITVFQADLIKSFAIFYLLLVGNYVGPSLFTCVQIKHITSNKWVQIVLSFLLFYFLVTIVSSTGNLEFTPPIEKLIHSILYFIGFLIVMRLDTFITVIVMLLIFVIYFIELNKEFYLEQGKDIHDPLEQDIYNANKYWITTHWPIRLQLFPVKNEDFTVINKIENILYYIIILLLICGFISYGGEIHDTVRRSNKLTWIDVITDTSICKLKDRKSFWHYLKVGLGMRI